MDQWYHDTVLEVWEILVLNRSEADRASSMRSFVKDVAPYSFSCTQCSPILFCHSTRASRTPFVVLSSLTPMPMEHPNSINAQAALSFLAVIVLLSELLRYRTERHCMLLRGRSSKASRMSRPCRNLSLPPPPPPCPPHLSKVLALLHSHHPSHC